MAAVYPVVYLNGLVVRSRDSGASPGSEEVDNASKRLESGYESVSDDVQ